MTDPAVEPTPLTAAEIEQRVKDTIMTQQQQLLEIAGRNALKMLREEQKKTAPTLMDAMDDELEKANEYANHEWRTQINRDNFNSVHEIEKMWKPTERFVKALEVDRDQADLKKGAVDFIEKGKKLTRDRMKVIRYADRDGWQAALHFVGDNIADTEAEAKRMRKSKKETEKDREAARSRRERDSREYRSSYSSREGQGSSRTRDTTRRFAPYRPDTRLCFNCGGVGHIARTCTRR